MTAIVNTDLLRRAFVFVCLEETRYYISGVRIEPHAAGGALLVATDGHVLVAFRDPEGFCDDPVTVKFHPPRLRPFCAKHADPNAVVVHGGHAAVVRYGRYRAPRRHGLYTKPPHPHRRHFLAAIKKLTGDVLEFFPNATIDGTFPKWRDVVKREAPREPAASVTIDPEIMARFHQGFGRSITMKGGGRDGETPIAMQIYADTRDFEAWGLVMPRRPTVETIKSHPFWIEPEKTEPADAPKA